jgi:hypothetical protein
MVQMLFIAMMLFPGYLLFKDFCENCCDENVSQMTFYDEVCSVVPQFRFYMMQVIILSAACRLANKLNNCKYYVSTCALFR